MVITRCILSFELFVWNKVYCQSQIRKVINILAEIKKKIFIWGHQSSQVYRREIMSNMWYNFQLLNMKRTQTLSWFHMNRSEKKIHKIFNILKLITIATIRQLIQYPQIKPVLICHKWKLKYLNVTEKLQSFKLCKMRKKCQCRNIPTVLITLGKKMNLWSQLFC